MLNRTKWAGCALALIFFLPSIVFAATDPAEGWKELWNKLLIDITLIGLVFALITLYFMIRYRRREPDQEGRPVKLTIAAAIAWVVIPAAVFMADDFFLAFKGWQLWNDYRTVPTERIEIELETRMWNWFFTYPGGVQTFDELLVPEGKPVLIRMKSADVVHSLYLPAFKVKEDSMPGRITYLWFLPSATGEYVFTCAEYCGVLHSNMTGTLKVLPAQEFQEWLDSETAKLGGA